MFSDPAFPFIFPLLLLGGLLVAIAGYVWRRGSRVTAAVLAVHLMAMAVWVLGYALELASGDLESKIGWAKVEYLGIVTLPVTTLAFALCYTARNHLVVRRTLIPLCIIPGITLLLVWTNQLHQLIWSDVRLDTGEPIPMLAVHYGPWFWVHTGYAYLLLGLGSGLLVQMLFWSPRLYRRQSGALILAIMVPWVANVLYLLRLNPLPGLDLTAYAFPVSGVLLAWDLYRFNLLDVAPSEWGGQRRSDDAVLVVDAHRRILDLNPAAQHLLGIRASESLGHSLADVAPALAREIEPYLNQPAASQPVVIARETGSRQRFYEVSASPLQPGSRRLTTTLLLLHDITERKRRDEERIRLLSDERAARAEAEAARRQLAFLSEAGKELVGLLDAPAILERTARLAVPMLGDWCAVYTSNPAGDEIRQAAESGVPPDWPDAEGVAIAERVARTLQPLHSSDALDVLEGAAPAGLSRTDWMCVPLSAHHRVFGALLFVAHSAERRYASEDLALAQETAWRTALALDNARLYGEAQEAIRIREVFLSVASHELKTPLTTIKGYTQLLARHLTGTSLATRQTTGTMERLTAEVGRFESLVYDLFDLTQIQQGQLELHRQTFDLTEAARDAVGRFAALPETTSRHRFGFDGPEPIVGQWDRTRIDQVLSNLIGNAIKYSREDGLIQVAVHRDGSQVEITVQDEGVGMPSEDLMTVFQPFARGRSARLQANGSGLGLYITDQIVTRHGGTIAIDSEVGIGSTFTVRLPLTATAEDANSSEIGHGQPDDSRALPAASGSAVQER